MAVDVEQAVVNGEADGNAVTLPPPSGGRPDVLMVAGEHSGDEHAARLIRDLRRDGKDISICALGGQHMKTAGAQLLLDLAQYAVVGLVEVLRNYSFFKALMEEVVRWVGEYGPRMVCFVDYPGFNLRLAKRLYECGLARKAGGKIIQFFYISPQIWAWKRGRRHQMAKHLDALAVIFPFEVSCYEDTDLDTRFVGHPFMEDDFKAPVVYDAAGPVLLLPGSRIQAVSRIFPEMAEGWVVFRRRHPDFTAVVIYPDSAVHMRIGALLALNPGAKEGLVAVPVGRPVAARAVLTSSGTMSLACALAGIPGALAYKTHPLTYLFGRMLVKVPYIGIANLMLDPDPIYPEYIQSRANPARLSEALSRAVEAEERVRCANQAAKLREALTAPAEVSAPAWILELLGENGA